MGRRRTVRAFTLLLLGVFPAVAADNALVFSRTLGGSGGDVVSAMAVDPAGNLIVAGRTNSFDFPVTNGSVNTGTMLATSVDSGRTWKSLGNLPSGSAATIATDAGGVLYAGSTTGVFRSTDRGKTWTPAAPIPGLDCGTSGLPCGVTILTVDPTRAGVVYAGAYTGIFKTIDGGVTWTRSDNGIPKAPGFDYLVIDPFHPDVLYTSFGTNYRSYDGGANWATYDLPHESAGGIGGRGDRVAFDPFVSGTIYHSSYDGIFVSTNAGLTWTRSSPFVPVGVAADPLTRGVLYAVDFDQSVYRSADNGATFTRVYRDNLGGRLLVVDPSKAGVVLTSSVRSEDGGKTWSRLSLGRAPQRLLFDPRSPGVMFAATDVSTDAFVAKLDPSGEKILFATYLGGMGSETITGVTTDADGNIYVAGLSSSLDFPATPRPPSTALPGEIPDNAFVAKLDPSGALLYVTPVPAVAFSDVGSSLAVGPDRRAVMIGSRSVRSGQDLDCVVSKLSADGATFDFIRTIGGASFDFCKGVAVDRSNNIALTGTTESLDFPVTDGALQPSKKQGRHSFVTKLDGSGNIRFSTYLGGSDNDAAAAVAFDADGNVLVAGTTASKDFVTTPGAYQRSLRGNCPYPSSAVATGFIGTIISYQMDDGFVTKLDPSGALLFSTYLGGDCFDQVKGISLDVWGNVWVVGTTNSNQFPMVFPFDSGPAYAQYKAFATRLAPDGSGLYFSSYHGAGSNPVIAATPGGDAYIGGSTQPNYPAFSVALAAPPVAGPPYLGFVGRIGGPPSSSMAIVSAGNAFTMRNGPIVPGELTLIDVVGMADVDSIDLGFRPTAPLPRQLGRAQVFFDDEPAAIISVTHGRILCVAPYSLAGKTATRITVLAQGDRSPAYRVDVFTNDPGARSADGSGQGRALALNQDGTVNSPDNPAPRGSTVTFFVTGAPPPASCPYGGVAPPDVAPDARGFAPIPGMVCGLQALTFKVNANAPPNADTQFPINGFLTSQTLTFAVK